MSDTYLFQTCQIHQSAPASVVRLIFVFLYWPINHNPTAEVSFMGFLTIKYFPPSKLCQFFTWCAWRVSCSIVLNSSTGVKKISLSTTREICNKVSNSINLTPFDGRRAAIIRANKCDICVFYIWQIFILSSNDLSERLKKITKLICPWRGRGTAAWLN